MDEDCRKKRAEFIDNAVKVREEFNFAHPSEILNAVQKYSTTFHGSNLYTLHGSTAVDSIYKSWRTNVKLTWDLPRNCHNFFIATTLAPQLVPPEISMLTKWHRFFLSLKNSPSKEVQVISWLAARDIRTSIGSNLDALKRETGLDPHCFGTDRLKQ